MARRKKTTYYQFIGGFLDGIVTKPAKGLTQSRKVALSKKVKGTRLRKVLLAKGKRQTRINKVRDLMFDSTLIASSLGMSFVNPLVGLPALGIASAETIKDIRKYKKKKR